MAPSVWSRVPRWARGVGGVVALLLAAACTTSGGSVTPRHVAPSEGPTARLVMRAKLPAGEAYRMSVFDDVERCTGPRTLGVGNAERHPATTELPGGRTQTVEVALVRANRQQCVIRLSFEPQAGRSYLFNAASVRGGCEAGILDMSDPDDMQREPSVRHRNPGTEQCLPLASSRPLAGVATRGQASNGEAVLERGRNADDLRGLMTP